MKGCSFENEIDNSNGIQKITLKGKNVGGIVNVLCIDLSQSNLDYDMEYILENFGDYCFNQTFVQMSGISNDGHLLSGRIYCAKCGATYKFRNGKRGAYWVCRKHDMNILNCENGSILESDIYSAFTRLCNKLWHNYKQILVPLQTALQDLKLKKFSGKTQVMDIHKEIAKLREQTHVLARLKTKGFLDEAKFIEQTTELTAKINKLQAELKKLTRSDDEDETLNQIEILIDFFEKRENIMIDFEESEFESIVEKIVVVNQNELKFYLIGGLKFKEKI